MSNSENVAGSGPETPTDTVRQTIIESVEAPRLRDISTEDFVLFKQKLEVYERQIAEKNAESGIQVPLKTYWNSITKPVLDIFVTACWVPVESVEDITEQHLRQCVEEPAQVNPEEYNLAQIERDLKYVRMDKNTKSNSLEMQVLRLGLKYSTTLENLGYSEFIEKQPQLAVEHVIKRVTHEQLRKRMLLTIKLRKEEGFKKNYKAFMRELLKEAKQIDRHEAAKGLKARSNFSDSDDDLEHKEGPKPDCANKDRRRKKGASGSGANGKSNAGKDKPKRDRTSCLNPVCDGHHYMNECPMTSDEDKKKLVAEYHEAKKARKGAEKKRKGDKYKGNIGTFGGAEIEENSSLFSATFCTGAVEGIVPADQGSDINVIPPSLLTLMLEADASLQVIELDETLEYSNASLEAAPLRCSRKVTSNVMLRIRHGRKMMMPGMEWLVSDGDTKYAIIRREVLSAIGLDNRTLMAAACDRHDGVLNIPKLLEKAQADAQTPIEGSIHSILQSRAFEHGSTYHSTGGAEEDMLEESDVYVGLGEDPKEDLEAALDGKVEKARANGLSTSGASRLTRLFKKYKQVFDFGWENSRQPMLSL
ncbi:hypothetical protein BWQ96_05502 [Gracilariopsis chorda]|uniref:Uncharacterized protein n=1 Tax=Gracilariopsis chorda TaxID=448386 RepID=A0A2V3IRL8_9FLOR|nr:hypothetical protein BWQ96_05502 [Gracilariopsis chorda]|eukprot:PXF44743.1 hypothetical protein BWQ96_05502 [Gracilariopsis chorda]